MSWLAKFRTNFCKLIVPSYPLVLGYPLDSVSIAVVDIDGEHQGRSKQAVVDIDGEHRVDQNRLFGGKTSLRAINYWITKEWVSTMTKTNRRCSSSRQAEVGTADASPIPLFFQANNCTKNQKARIFSCNSSDYIAGKREILSGVRTSQQIVHILWSLPEELNSFSFSNERSWLMTWVSHSCCFQVLLIFLYSNPHKELMRSIIY